MVVELTLSPPIEIRPIESHDKAGLAAALDQSSSEAIYRRFLGPHGPLSAAELRYLTEVDHHDHEALVAIDPESGHSVGVARYIRDRERRDSAEVAFSVLETWQGRGLGKALLRRLADRARDEGISRFTALMLAHNRPMRQLLADLGATRVLSPEPEQSSSPSICSAISRVRARSRWSCAGQERVTSAANSAWCWKRKPCAASG